MLASCTIHGTIEQPTGVVSGGALSFTPDRFVDLDDKVIVAAVPVVVVPDPDTAEFSVDLVYHYVVNADPMSDVMDDTFAGTLSAPTPYAVSEPFGDDYTIEIDATLGGSALLADLHP